MSFLYPTTASSKSDFSTNSLGPCAVWILDNQSNILEIRTFQDHINNV